MRAGSREFNIPFNSRIPVQNLQRACDDGNVEVQKLSLTPCMSVIYLNMLYIRAIIDIRKIVRAWARQQSIRLRRLWSI